MRPRRRIHDFAVADHGPIVQCNAVACFGDTDWHCENGAQQGGYENYGAHGVSFPEGSEPYNYNDSSVNGSIDPEFTDDEGPLWDVDAGFPDEPDEDDDEDEE